MQPSRHGKEATICSASALETPYVFEVNVFFRNNIPPGKICTHFSSSAGWFTVATVINDFTKAFVQLKQRPQVKKKNASFPLLGSISRRYRCFTPPIRIWGPSICQEEKEKPLHSSTSLHPYCMTQWPTAFMSLIVPYYRVVSHWWSTQIGLLWLFLKPNYFFYVSRAVVALNSHAVRFPLCCGLHFFSLKGRL